MYRSRYPSADQANDLWAELLFEHARRSLRVCDPGRDSSSPMSPGRRSAKQVRDESGQAIDVDRIHLKVLDAGARRTGTRSLVSSGPAPRVPLVTSL